jgi:lysine biosynthesis protein LysW
MLAASCPECEAKINFDSPLEVGERVFCPECDIELEVISAKPMTLDYALDDEDWEEDWDEE